ncbi:MAG: helix-turn-helix transcriptional regulator [Nitrospinae bacterium]|nr:helix-turn-helix transcriptional regulator [Nitrospinota bacterium]
MKKIIKKEIHDRIKEFREFLNLSQSEFGYRIGLSFQHVSRYERGEVVPSSKILTELCERYNVNINWLLTGKGWSCYFSNEIAEWVRNQLKLEGIKRVIFVNRLNVWMWFPYGLVLEGDKWIISIKFKGSHNWDAEYHRIIEICKDKNIPTRIIDLDKKDSTTIDEKDQTYLLHHPNLKNYPSKLEDERSSEIKELLNLFSELDESEKKRAIKILKYLQAKKEIKEILEETKE